MTQRLLLTKMPRFMEPYIDKHGAMACLNDPLFYVRYPEERYRYLLMNHFRPYTSIVQRVGVNPVFRKYSKSLIEGCIETFNKNKSIINLL